MTTTASHLIATARAELGQTESPAGSNRCRYSSWYGLVGPWCAMFVSYVADKAGAADIIPRHAYTPSGAAWFEGHFQWDRTPRVGAIVYYEFPGLGRVSHVGIVVAVHSDGSWTAIEGNTDEAGGRTGGKVMEKRRYPSALGARGGFGHPNYLPEPRKAAVSHAVPKYPGETKEKHGRALRKKSAATLAFQKRLKARGWHIATDGIHGPATTAVLKSYQREKHLTVDGVGGPKTWASLWTSKVTR